MALTRPRSWQLLDSDYKDSVRAATTEPVNLNAAPTTIDDVILSKRNRILVKNQSNAAQNGIYYIQTLGTGSNGVWVRAADFASDKNISSGLQVPVEEGTINGNRTYQLITDDPIILNTTPLTFAPSSGGGLDEVTDIGNVTTNGITVGNIIVDNLYFDSNTISSITTNANIILDPNGSGTVILESPLTQNATTAPITPLANSMVMYVTATGTSPNREIAWKIKNETGDEIIISSVLV